MIDANYLVDASGFTGFAERLFVPTSEEEVTAILKNAVSTGTTVTISGAGSGLTGGRVAQGGWILSLEKFTSLEIEVGFARVGAAVSLMDIRDAAAKTRQFYAPDPTEIMASIGGTIATNASGSRSFRFGSTRRHIRALRVALLTGEVIEYRRGDKVDFDVPAIPFPDTAKFTAGYRLQPGMDWIDLFCGSEGTLGVILEAEIALLPIPNNLFAGVVFFDSDEQALEAVDEWRCISDLRMLEYFDRNSLELLRSRYPETPPDAAAALLIEAEGEDVEGWEARLEASGALTESSWFALTAKDRERFRAFRHAFPEVVLATVRQRGFMNMGTDYAVPIDRNREMMAYYRERLDEELPGHYAIFGHIGEAHVHVNMLPATQLESEKAAALLTDFAQHAVKLGGTVSAEHGLGRRKASLLALQYSPEQIAAMVSVKCRFDPSWILGRGTIFSVKE